MTQLHPKPFAVGDVVEKFTGDYTWRGEISAIFLTPNGKERVVIAHPVGKGYVLHIYAPPNLRYPITGGKEIDLPEPPVTPDPPRGGVILDDFTYGGHGLDHHRSLQSLQKEFDDCVALMDAAGKPRPKTSGALIYNRDTLIACIRDMRAKLAS